MIQKRIFKKTKSKKYIILLFIILFIILILSIYTFLLKNQFTVFNVNKNTKEFYFIPTDTQGKIISNVDKKILDYDYNLNQKFNNNDINYKYSIQLYASSNYDLIIDKNNEFGNNISFIKNYLSIVALKHNLGIDYILIYKNFSKREEAYDYCNKYLNFIENCLIINVQNLYKITPES